MLTQKAPEWQSHSGVNFILPVRVNVACPRGANTLGFSNPDKVEVKIENGNKNVSRLGLEEIYNMHKDLVADIVAKAQAYNDSYYQSLVDSYNGLGKTPEEIYRLIWGTYMNPQEYGMRPLSKFTKDILDELGIK